MFQVDLKWLAVAVLTMLASVLAAQTVLVATTRISLAKLHGNGFIKKIDSQLTQVAGMEKVEGDLVTRLVTH